MRFHSLTVTAFGPYAGTEVVDFDELNEAGIFLLCGPTGAGKTSILDAICFALYGVVPGERGVKVLRSHHSAPGARPEVVLEVTIGTRRFRIRRSPEWHRPKKRGEGETKENASASLVELSGDDDRLVSSRIQEVGHELGLLLGMSADQFMQVVMLPQGQFQTFLRASSDDRQGVLQRLFATQRFARIEEWMRDRTKELGTQAVGHERRVAQLLATIADRSTMELPASLAADPLGDVAERAGSWATSVVDQLKAEHERALHRERTALELLAEAEAADREATRVAAARGRRLAAERTLAELSDSEAQCAAEVESLHRHERALRVRPLLHPVGELERSLERARARRDKGVRELDRLPELLRPSTADRAGCESAQSAHAERVAVLRSVQPHEKELADTQTALGAAQDDLFRLHQLLDTTSLRTAQLPGERRALDSRLAAARATAATYQDARSALEAAHASHEASRATVTARDALDQLVERARLARDDAADAREKHLDIVERRLAGMAAELAGQLVDGAACQVCGSHTHPSPAEPSSDAVTGEDQRAAHAAYQRLRAAADELTAQADESGRVLQQLEKRSGGRSPEDAAGHLAGCQEAVSEAETALALLPRLETDLTRHDAEDRRLAALLQSSQGRVGARESEIHGLHARIEAISDELTAALGLHRGPVTRVIRSHEQALAVLEEALETLVAFEQAQERFTDARDRADAAAAEEGFAAAAEARLALLDPTTVEAVQQAARARDELRREALAVLRDEEVQRVDRALPPDLEQSRALVTTAKEAARRCAAEVGSAERTSAALVALAEQLHTAIATWAPVRDEHETVERMSRLVRGMSTDNQLQMRLSSYVLATRLDQVLEAANERLAQMRDQRYALGRTGRARGGTRSGLGLEVRDSWTGEVRDPCTLSGGETFVVSLALALGLADVVIQESGGLRVDTLFIDEGFGMLDADTLDDVMDRIDALRAGGRTVGVVSHVSELRGRIPTQLHVTRGRTGSTVEVRTLIA